MVWYRAADAYIEYLSTPCRPRTASPRALMIHAVTLKEPKAWITENISAARTSISSEKAKHQIVTSSLDRRTRSSKRKRTTSPHFAPQGHVALQNPPTPPCVGVQWRSSYFVSSPDSCTGSAAKFDWGSAYTKDAVDAFRACPNFKTHGVRHLCRRLCFLHAYEVST